MVELSQIFNTAMALMDELPSTGSPRDTSDYEARTPAIIGSLIGELMVITGEREMPTLPEDLDDPIEGVEDTFALAALHYGLAANLLVDENPAAASFYEQRYEELRDRYLSRLPAKTGEIEDMYGGIEYGRFGRW